ncbi:hypothetical protein [Streptomyces sp. NPDC058086]|uniref:hypothetical protein n=1 Tax=Streptomyces sp. NPDC058086 TaxID=3346334 RepID=UPI0036EF902A
MTLAEPLRSSPRTSHPLHDPDGAHPDARSIALTKIREVSQRLDRALVGANTMCFALISVLSLTGSDVFSTTVLPGPLTVGLLLCLIQALVLLWTVDRYDRQCARRLEPLTRLAAGETAELLPQGPHTLFARPGRNP